MHDEKSLVERAQQNDKEAFAAIYEEHFDRIYRYVFLRVRNQPEAEDLTQQVFLKAMLSIGSYRWHGPPLAAWLFRIAHNQVVDFQRRLSKIQMSVLDTPVPASDPDPAQIVEQHVEFERIKMAVTGLTQLQQEVIALRFAGELSTLETAKAMGKSEGAIKALQHSAMAALRKILSVEYEHGQEV